MQILLCNASHFFGIDVIKLHMNAGLSLVCVGTAKQVGQAS